MLRFAILASLLLAASAFGQCNNNNCNANACCECSCCCRERLCPPTEAAYNAPARIDTKCPWDVWVDGSYLYWEAFQDNMEPVLLIESGSTDAATFAALQGSLVNMDFQFKMGYKAGIGIAFDHDHCDASAEYTYFHEHV